MSSWPYDDPPDPSPEPGAPTWECPDKKCACKAVADEKVEKMPIEILLRDDLGKRMGGAKCRIWHHHKLIGEDLSADGSGWVKTEVPVGAKHLYLEWAPSDLPHEPEYPIRKGYIVEVQDQADEEAARRRLANLGYDRMPSLSENVSAFQRDRGVDPTTGDYRDIESELASYHDEGVDSGGDGPRLPKGEAPPAQDGPADAQNKSSFVPMKLGPGDSGGPVGQQAGGGGNGGTAQTTGDFPTPLEAEAQGKTFHEFQSIGASMTDGNGKEWWIHLLVSRDALKWEVPTATVRGTGVSLTEGQYWARMFKDMTNPDPIIPQPGLDPKRTIRLPTSAENAQKYADATSFTVATLMAQRTLKDQASMPVFKAPSPDPPRACLIPTPMIYDLRYDMQHLPTQTPQTSPNGGNPSPPIMIPDTQMVNDKMNALYTPGDFFVCNPGKFWAIANKLYNNPQGAKTRRTHSGTKKPIACNYGWYVASKALAGTTGGRSVNGQFWVIQLPEAGHDIQYKDYSQVLILVAGQFVLSDPYTGKSSWEPTVDLYLNQGAVKAAETAHGVQLTKIICHETPLVTATTL